MKKVVVFMFLSLVILGFNCPVHSATITIQGPDKVIDSHIYGESTPSDANSGDSTLMKSYMGGVKFNPLFQFDLTGLGISGSQITKVEIMLYVNSYDGDIDRHFYLKRVLNEWVESEVTGVHRKSGVQWDNQSSYPWGDIGSTIYGDIVLGDTHGTGWAVYSSDDNSDLLDLVKDMVDGNVSNYGFTVEATGTTGPYFRTSEYTDDPSTQPKMVITYVPEPATIGLTVLGIFGVYRKR